MIFLLYIVQCRYVLLQERKVQYGSRWGWQRDYWHCGRHKTSTWCHTFMRLLKGHRQFTTSGFSNSRKKILWYCSFTHLICVFFWFNGHLGECGFGEFRLSLLPSPVCAFQSTNRPRGRKGVYFQGSAPMIPFTFVIAFMLRPIIPPLLTMISTLYDLKHTLNLSTRHRLCLAIVSCHAKYWTKMMSLKGLKFFLWNIVRNTVNDGKHHPLPNCA